MMRKEKKLKNKANVSETQPGYHASVVLNARRAEVGGASEFQEMKTSPSNHRKALSPSFKFKGIMNIY